MYAHPPTKRGFQSAQTIQVVCYRPNTRTKPVYLSAQIVEVVFGEAMHAHQVDVCILFPAIRQ